MNIVYFYPHLKHQGGIERILTAKANYLADVLGHNITIVTYRQFGGDNFFRLSKKIKQINLDINDPIIFKKKINSADKKNYTSFYKKYQKAVENFLIQNPQDIAVSLFFGKEYNFLPNIKDKSKKILELHFNYHQTPLAKSKELNQLRSYSDIKNFYYSEKLKSIIRKYDKLVVLSKSDYKNWKEDFKNSTYIYNFYPFDSDEKSLLKAKTVISVGRLTHQKGFDRLISAWEIVHKKHPDWILNIIGDGELEKKLKNQVKSLGLENSIFIKPTTKNIEKEYLESSIYVMSSNFEGFPMVLLEASHIGLPCISFDCNYGPNELIQNNYDGFIVEQNNIELLAYKISLLIEDEELRHSFSERTILKMENFRLEKIIGQWKNLFQELVIN